MEKYKRIFENKKITVLFSDVDDYNRFIDDYAEELKLKDVGYDKKTDKYFVNIKGANTYLVKDIENNYNGHIS